MKSSIHKSPAFQFYVQDFLVGTLYFSAEEIGGYLLLLCHQWENGFINKNEIEIISRQKKANLVRVLKKFHHEKGKYVNKRLEKVRNEQIEHSERRSRAGKLGAQAKWSKTDDSNAIENNDNATLENSDAIFLPMAKNSSSTSTSTSTSLKENIIKEKKISQFPKDTDLPNELPEKQNSNAIEIYKLNKNLLLTCIQVNRFWCVFKIQNLTGKKFYADIGDVYSHFLNWIKLQNVEAIHKQQKETIYPNAHDIIAKNGY